jgi:hypothetical protein
LNRLKKHTRQLLLSTLTLPQMTATLPHLLLPTMPQRKHTLTLPQMTAMRRNRPMNLRTQPMKNPLPTAIPIQQKKHIKRGKNEYHIYG